MSDDVWRRSPSPKPDDQELMNVGGRHEDPTNAFPTGSVAGSPFADGLLEGSSVGSLGSLVSSAKPLKAKV